MSFIVRDIYEQTTNRTTGATEIIAHIVADDASSLPQNTTDRTFVLGSDTRCVDTGDTYMIKSDGTWVLQPSDNAWSNMYTKTEIDALLQQIVDNSLKRSDLYRGYQIESGTDVDTLTDYGTYYCADGTTAATLSNCPITTSGFIMTIFSNGNRVRMFYAVSATVPRMYIQARTGGTWRTIRQFAMTDEIQYSENMLGYSWGRYNVAESTGEVNASTTRIGTPDYFSIPSGTSTITYSPYFDGVAGDTFYLFYDSSKTYNNTYIGWVSSGVPVKVPSGMSYYRLCFRRPDNATIVVSDMIRCTRNYQ